MCCVKMSRSILLKMLSQRFAFKFSISLNVMPAGTIVTLTILNWLDRITL